MTGPHLLAVTGATARAVRWSVPLGSWLAVGLLLTLADDQLARPGSALTVVRGVAVMAVLGAVFLLDDDAGVTVASSPTSLVWRRVPRVLLAVAVVAVPWAAALWRLDGHGTHLPVAGLTLELTALLALALGAATVAQRRLPDPAVVVAPVVAFGVLSASRLPLPLALITPPGPLWAEAHTRWTALLLMAIAALWWSSRDPATARSALVRVVRRVPGCAS